MKPKVINPKNMRYIVPAINHKCHNCKQDIPKREECYLHLSGWSGKYPTRRSYCESCGKEIIRAGKAYYHEEQSEN